MSFDIVSVYSAGICTNWPQEYKKNWETYFSRHLSYIIYNQYIYLQIFQFRNFK